MPAPTKTEFAIIGDHDDALEYLDDSEDLIEGSELAIAWAAYEEAAAKVKYTDYPDGKGGYDWKAYQAACDALIAVPRALVPYEAVDETSDYEDGSTVNRYIVRDKRDGKLWQTYSTHTSWVGTETFFDEWEEVTPYVHTETKYKVVR